MKIAVIGGNLLGCATVLNLALVQESDRREGHSDVNFSVTLYERTDRLGGNSFKTHVVDEDLHVEVGTYRTIAPIPGTYLDNLILAAKGQDGTAPIFRYIDDATTKYRQRGRSNVLKTKSLWASGTHGRVVRTFGVYDAQSDDYWLDHGGFPILNLMHRVLNHGIWRSVAFGFMLSACKKLSSTRGQLPRAIALVNVLLCLFLFIRSPRGVIAFWQRNLAFWYTTLGMMLTYGVTAPIIRGSAVGVIRTFSEANKTNAGTLCTTPVTLASRLGIKEHVQSTGRQFVNMFNLNMNFARKLVEPSVRLMNDGKGLDEISSLGVQFALIDGDHVNSDAESRLRTIVPNNASLCGAIIDTAKGRMSVDVRYDCKVTCIRFDDGFDKYVVTAADGSTDVFDGVVLAVSSCGSQADELLIVSGDGNDVTDMVKCGSGEDRDKEKTEIGESVQSSTRRDAWSHIAVVTGEIRAGYFRYSCESEVPDCLMVANSGTISMVERMRETTKDGRGVYVVRCGADLNENGMFERMFIKGSELVYFERLASAAYDTRAFKEGEDIDQVAPPIILGRRFVYAAAIERMGKHAELDAASAVNAASLFSKVVKWSVVTDDDDDDNGGTDIGDEQ